MINYYYSNSDTNYSQIFEDLNLAEYSKCIVFLNGEIGSGKTSIVRSYIKLFNLNKTITSPTFTLINEYNIDNFKIFHYDLFRLNSPKELLEIGIDHYFSQEGIHFIEWPEKFLNLLPVSNYDIFFTILENSRLIKVIENY